MQERAVLCDIPALAADYLAMAHSWRAMAARARWQDAFGKLNPTLGL